MSQSAQGKSQSNLYDNVAKVAVKAKEERFKKAKQKDESKDKEEGLSSSQVNNFLEYSQSTTDKNELFIFIMRQAKRGGYTETARLMLSYLKDKDIAEIRKFIGLLKWVMDAIENIKVPSNIDSFDKLLDLYIKSNANSDYFKPKYQGGHHGYGRS